MTGRLGEVRTGRGSASSERKTRGVGRTRVAGKAEDKVTKARVSMGMQEDQEAKERDRRCRVRKMRRTGGAEWRLTWMQVAHTPSPRRILEKEKKRRKRHECLDGRL